MKKHELDILYQQQLKAREENTKARRVIRINKKKALVTLSILAIVLYFISNILILEYQYWTLHKKESTLQSTLEDEQIESRELQDEIDNANTKTYIEYLAKKYLGLIYPDEKIYVPVDQE